MLFVSRLVLGIGALFASTREFSTRPDPGDYTNLVHWDPVASRAHSATPVVEVSPSGLVSRLVSSRSRIGRRRLSIPTERSFVEHSPSLAPTSISTYSTHPNVTRLGNGNSVKSITFTVLPYDGPKGLAVYCRPTSLVVYTGLTDYAQFWIDPSHYDLIVHVYRPRFVIDAHLAKKYGHLDPTNFDEWAVDNPIDVLLNIERPHIRQALGYIPPRYITIGRFEHQLEETLAQTLAHLYALGFLLVLAMMSFEEYVELRKALERHQSEAVAPSSSSDHDSLVLPGVVCPSSSEESVLDVKAEVNWWKAGEEETGTSEYSTSTSFLELPAITKLDLPPPADASTPTPLSTSTDVPTSAEVSPGPNAPSRVRKALPPRPSGPRFKTSAWRRCRIK